MADGDMLSPAATGHPSRRGLLTGAAAVGGGLLIGFSVGGAEAQTPKKAPYFQPNAFLQVGRDGMVTLILPKSEMGQGINTTLAMLVAEELAVSLDQVRVTPGPPDKRLALGRLGQNTGGSQSVMSTWTPLRQAGASARVVLIAAAAQAWGVTADACTARNCQVIHVSTGRKLDYGQLVDVAATLPIPQNPPLKPLSDFTLIGKSHNRIDAAGKVNGSTVFGIDVVLPKMKFAALMASPVRGGKVNSIDDREALAVKGVDKVINAGEFVAVVGAHMGAARKGLSVLHVVWDDGPNAGVSQADIAKTLDEASLRADKADITAYKRAEVDAALSAPGCEPIEAVYRTPFLAHAAMEPMNCTVHVQKDRAELWLGSQDPPTDQRAAAKALGLPLEAITVNNQQMGGGFGRKSEEDVATRAVLIGQQVDGPVKVVWSREEDMGQDFYQPSTVYRFAALLGADGKPEAWKHTYAAGSVAWRRLPTPAAGAPARPERNTLIYDFPNAQGYVHQEIAIPSIPSDAPNHGQALAVPIGYLRGVESDHRVFAIESFVDELAHAAGQDPVAYRLSMMSDPRAIGVLKLAAEKSGWGSPMPAGQGRGVTVFFGFGSYLATVAEVAVDPKSGDLKLLRIVSAVDCGVPINPRNIEAQTFGGCVYGLSSTLRGQITFTKGRPDQSNFDDYEPLRLKEAPRFEVHIVQSTASPGGLGETSAAGVPAAVTNAIFAATGKRVRDLPISNTRLV